MDADLTAAKRDELVVELYKSMRAEAIAYIEKVPALWLQKFILVGAMLAFLLTQKDSLDFIGEGDPAEATFDVALLTVPALACLLDAKMLEYGIHARIISSFIESEFSSVSQVRSWERTLWGYSDDSFRDRLTKIRSATTVLVTVGPTLLIIALGTALVSVRRQTGWILLGGAALCLFYIAVAVIVLLRVWPSRGATQ